MAATFSFNTTPALLIGVGASRVSSDRLRAILGARIIVVTDPGLRQSGLLDPVLGGMTAQSIETNIFDSVSADPPEAEVEAALEAVRAHRATGILGFGGGSPMDVAKAVALVAGSGERLSDAYGVGNARGPRLPLVLIPTTAGTGSEVTPIAILTTGETEKKGIVSPLLLPDMAILDAELTLGLPPAATAATGIDAMVHAIEAYASASPNNNPISRNLAREALRLLGGSIRTACQDGRQLAARENMLIGAMLAGQAFANSPVAAVHALAYPIGAHFHVPHGVSNALVLPHVLRFNIAQSPQLYAEIASDAVPNLSRLPPPERSAAFADALQKLSAELKLPQRLRDVGIAAEDLPMLARDAIKQTRLLVNNPRSVSEADALAIYRAAW
ncbi:MAG: iron-containing alcohol dehydrogenase [Rhizobiales bacterium]|nr:iron-containing alcohol dehydrogenase [Hyphomicrobiales bacterium]